MVISAELPESRSRDRIGIFRVEEAFLETLDTTIMSPGFTVEPISVSLFRRVLASKTTGIQTETVRDFGEGNAIGVIYFNSDILDCFCETSTSLRREAPFT